MEPAKMGGAKPTLVGATSYFDTDFFFQMICASFL